MGSQVKGFFMDCIPRYTPYPILSYPISFASCPLK